MDSCSPRPWMYIAWPSFIFPWLVMIRPGLNVLGQWRHMWWLVWRKCMLEGRIGFLESWNNFGGLYISCSLRPCYEYNSRASFTVIGHDKATTLISLVNEGICDGWFDKMCMLKGDVRFSERCSKLVNPLAFNFLVFCFVVVLSTFSGDSCDIFIHIFQACFTGTGAIIWLPQCLWSNPEGSHRWNQTLPNSMIDV